MPNDPTPPAAHPPTSTESARRQVAHDEIARRAAQLWRDRGQPAGQDEALWLEAESELQARAESRPVSGTESRPYIDEPATPVRSQTKSRDPADAAAQTRSPTDANSRRTAGRLRHQ